ncbi:hypothetical protein BOQ62_20850 [Chryseobacterium sp. CH21]|uniref:hypothetical protein n=1 Tax=Chryseobacterium sp. CH21 TaxID=713556 RepID=UPI00100B76DE|nr:hypothetical protein [Chryseobacterium sp. CH21]RXM37776.1 hypothetical protein BOQ62_20850 [Chryseobacterium sp. CH21]
MLKDLLIFLNIIKEVKVPVPMQWQERKPVERFVTPRVSKTEWVREPEVVSMESTQESFENITVTKNEDIPEYFSTGRERKSNRNYLNRINNLAEYTKGYKEYCLEKTSNQHMLKAEDYHIYAKNGTTETFLIAKDAFITHNEHKMLRIESDCFVKYIQQEYNPITQMIENAYD